MGGSEVMFMFTFSIVKKIGEGNYLNDESFILERVRKVRALNARLGRAKDSRLSARNFSRNDRFRLS